MAEVARSATVSIELGEDELLGAHLMARMQGVAAEDVAQLQHVLRRALAHGLESHLDAAGMHWPPTADDVKLADSVAREIAPGSARDDSPRTPWFTARMRLAAGAITAALIVLLIGGYGMRWSWTGFAGNNQVWDWMQLLLLPIALATFPLWISFSGYMSPARRRALLAATAAFVVFVLVGYLNPLRWTGFRGHSLWDWMTLLILPVSIVAVRAWPQSGRDVHRVHIAAGVLLCAAFIATIIGGYEASWNWTGYEGNTLWDWLTLVLGPAAVTTILVPALVKLLTGSADERAERDRMRRARDEALRGARARIPDAH